MRRLVPLALLLCVAPVAAEDPPAAPAPESPAARTTRVLAALPPPAAEHAWTYVGDMLVGGSPLGVMCYSMQVVEHEGQPAWKAVDELQVGTPHEGVHVRAEALLDARLGALAGTTVSETTGEPTLTVTWRREGAAYALERRVGEQVTRQTLPSPGLRLATLSAQIHLLRALPAEPGAYAWPELVVEPNVGDDRARRLRDVAAQALEPAPFEHAAGKPLAARVRLAHAGEEERAALLSLAAEGRAFLGLEQSASKLVVRPNSPPDEPPAVIQAPPRTAKAAALRAARALAVGDARALGRVLNWAKVDERLAQDPEFAPLDPAARRARMLEKLDEQLEENPPEMIDMVLGGVEDSLQVEDLGGGRARVIFPEIFRGMKLVVVQVGDAWLLDDLPGKP